MKKIVVTIGVAALIAWPATAAAFGPSQNPHAVAACGANIDKQTANGVS